MDSEINIDSKKIVVDLIDSEISIIERHQQDELTAYIIDKNQYKQSEFPEVLASYDSLGEETKKAIENELISSPYILFNNLEKASSGLRKSLLHNDRMVDRLLILTSLVPELDKNGIEGYLTVIGDKELSCIFNNYKSKSVNKVDGIDTFLNKMKELGYIVSYKNEEQKIKIIIRR